MRTILWGVVALVLCILLGFGIWYALSQRKAYPAGSEAGSPEQQQSADGETATSSAPILESYYEAERMELYTALSITLIPIKLGKEPMNGIEIALENQQPPLPEPYQVIINANISGELQQEWTCETLNKSVVRCGGSMPLALGESTVLALYFNRPPALPQHIRLEMLHGANVVATVEATKR